VFSLKKPETKSTSLDEAIDTLVSELAGAQDGSEEEARISESVKKLCEAKATLQNADQPDFVKADTLALIAGNLAGIVLILSFEHVNVITSKALSFVTKPKI
jgi:hypothetical protein